MNHPSENAAMLQRHWPDYAPTPLRRLERLAAHAGVGTVWVKDESHRPLGNFKVLGGLYAGLKALARAAGLASLDALVDRAGSAPLPRLLCASDGNHGLAVAEAARRAGAAARVYLHEAVPAARVARVAAAGAEIVIVAGTYDDAVDEAAAAAARGDGILVADTSDDLGDPVVADVMAGYGLIADELIAQLAAEDAAPTHLFVQAGVGGLAAALAARLHPVMAAPRRIVVVEPAAAACVAAALAAGEPCRIAGDLDTSAEMLACGVASAPALRVLLAVGAVSVVVDERELAAASELLPRLGGAATTTSGAAGLAGLVAAASTADVAARLDLDDRSRVLLIATEGAIDES